ncbi:hypothetical protein GM3709_1367 [Geminocystis sp. NIES-3709]|nr:hypothetical protein GM3709_1367 [Geminocystis sp. NIES-3709]
MRVDVRIPLEFYSEIENIAIATNQPPTPKSKNTDNPKPIVTPIILKLMELGLGVIENEGIEVLGENNIKPLPNTHISDKIEDKLFKRLEARLEQLLEARLRADTEEIKEDSDNSESITEDIKKDNSEIKNSLVNETITPEIMIENEVIERVSSGNENNEYVKNLNAIEVIPEVVIEDKEVSALNNDDIRENEFENGLFSKGLGNRLGYKGHSEVSKKFKDLSKEDFIQWTKEKDKNGIGWYRNETDNKYYPQK